MVALKLDSVGAKGVELAREAAETEGPGQVGEHLTVKAEADRVVTHFFACTHPGYTGWYWAVTLARASRSKVATVNEVVLLPGDEAITTPDWVPWVARVQPGDLGPGDLFPSPADDPRLTAGFTDLAADDDTLALVTELGLGRERVLTAEGRDEAAQRWMSGDFGPKAEIAQAAANKCGSCGYFVRLSGQLGNLFGVCTNAMGSGEGRVIAETYGCGAHSSVAPHRVDQPPAEPFFDSNSVVDLEDF